MTGPERLAELYLELKVEADGMGQTVGNVESQLDRVQKASDRAAGAVDGVTQALESIGAGGNFTQGTAAAAAALEKASESAREASEGLSNARREMEALGGGAATAAAQLDPLSDRVEAVVQSLAQVHGGSREVINTFRDIAEEAMRFGAISEEMSNEAITGVIVAAEREDQALAALARRIEAAREAEERRLAAYQKVAGPIETQIALLKQEAELKAALASGDLKRANEIIAATNARKVEQEVQRLSVKLNAEERQQIEALVKEKYALKTSIEQTTVAANSMRNRLSQLSALLGGPAVVGVGALAAAFAGVARAAGQMARDVDGAIATTVTVSGALTGQLSAVRQVVEDVARTSGLALREVSAVGADIARNGVSGIEDLSRRLKTASNLALATGTDLRTVALGLDQMLDTFGATSAQLDGVVETLFRISQAGVPLGDLFQSLQAAAPTLREFGISMDVAVAALAQLQREGGNARQAAAQFRQLAGEGEAGADRIRDLADSFDSAGDAAGTMAQKVDDLKQALGESKELGSEWEALSYRLGRGFNELRDVVAGVFNDWFESWDAFREKMRAGVDEIDRVSQLQRAVPVPLTTAAPIYAGLPSTGGGRPKTQAEVTAENRRREQQARDAQRNAQQVEAALARLQREIDAMTNQVFPRVVTATDEWNEALQREIEVLERGNAAQRARAEVLRQTGEAIARTVDLIKKAGLDDFKPNVQVTTYTTLDIQQIDKAAQAEERKAAAVRQQQRDKNDIAAQDARDRDAQDKRLRALIEQGRQIDAAVQGALDLAQAFGLADDQVVAILSNLSQVATGIKPLLAAIEKGGAAGIASAALPVVGGAAAFISGLAGAFGESPELKAARESLDRLRDSLEKNTATLRELDLGGSQISGTSSAIDRFLAEGLPRLQSRSRWSVEGVTSELDRFGLSLGDIRELAAKLNVPFIELTRETIPYFIQMLLEFGNELDEIASKGRYATDAMGRIQQAADELTFSVADESPGQVIRKYIEAAIGTGGFDDGSPILAAFFDGFDFDALDSNDPAVRNAARETLRQIVESIYVAITSEGFDVAALGDFSFSNLTDFLQDVLGWIPDALDESVGQIATASDKWAESVRNIGRASDVFGYTIAEEAQAIVAAFASLSPELAGWFDGFDLSTVEGMSDAIAFLQDKFAQFSKTSVHGATNELEALGLSLDDLALVIGVLHKALGAATDEAERLAEAEARAAEQARREAERAVEEQRRRWEQEQRERERAHQEEMRRLEEIKRITQALGSDTIRALEEGFRLFDITEPVDQLAQMFSLLSKQAPVFRTIFGGLSAESAGDRAEALQRLRDFQLANPFGVESGSLSADAVRQQVLTIAELLKSANAIETTEAGSLGSFAIDRSITELRGERLEGLLSTGNIWLEDIATSNAAILAALTVPSGFTGITPPSIPIGSVAGGPVFNIGTISVVVDGREISMTPSPSGAQSIGQLIDSIVTNDQLKQLGAG